MLQQYCFKKMKKSLHWRLQKKKKKKKLLFASEKLQADNQMSVKFAQIWKKCSKEQKSSRHQVIGLKSPADDDYKNGDQCVVSVRPRDSNDSMLR